MLPHAPMYEKIELLHKDGGNTIKLEFPDAGMVISGNKIIILTKDDEENSSTGKVFDMSDIESYKIYNITFEQQIL